MKLIQLFTLSTLLTAGLACGSSQGSQGSKDYTYSEDEVIEMSKGPCFGTCPVYDFRIDGRGNATFTGTTFVKKEGKHIKRFSAEETNALFDEYKRSDFWALEDEYTANVTDLPTTWLSFYFMDRSKKIRCYYGMPTRLVDLIEKTEALALSSDGWTGASTADK